MRYAFVPRCAMAKEAATVARYLPSNYSVAREDESGFYLEGEDNAGWTLEGYVIPRLQSGLIPCRETTLRVQVIADSSGEWFGNGLTFNTVESARKYAIDLAWRWTAVRQWRIVDANGSEIEHGS